MSRKLKRASQHGGKQSASAKPEVDAKFIKAFLEEGWTLLGKARDEEATHLAIRIVRLQETEETRAFFVECVRQWKFFPGAGEIRDLVARALREAWAKPEELFGLAKGILKSDFMIGPAIQRTLAAWPRRLSLQELADATGLAHISTDPLLLALLGRGSVFDIELERAATDASIASALTFTDFYTTSEFRDLFRPTQMLRFTIPKLQTFLDANNLELWDIFEKEQPDTFKEMYEFWLQKKKDPAMIERPSAHGSATFPEYKAADRSFLDPSSPVK